MAKHCTSCGKECFDDAYPEVVFSDGTHDKCEECSIDYEVDGNGKVMLRGEVAKIIGC